MVALVSLAHAVRAPRWPRDGDEFRGRFGNRVRRRSPRGRNRGPACDEPPPFASRGFSADRPRGILRWWARRCVGGDRPPDEGHRDPRCRGNKVIPPYPGWPSRSVDTRFDTLIYRRTRPRGVQSVLREKIAGEITLSEAPGNTMRKWRQEFRITQTDLARFMRVSPSVISDYESGRRTSPGIRTIKKLVDAILEIDRRAGQKVAKRYEEFNDAIPSMKEFSIGMRASDFLRKIDGRPLTKTPALRRVLNGYTVIDSIKAITTLDATDYLRIYGSSSERALLFTGVKYGRSPMIAIKGYPLKPAMFVYVQPENIDDLAVRLAELEGIVLARTELDPPTLIERLERLT